VPDLIYAIDNVDLYDDLLAVIAKPTQVIRDGAYYSTDDDFGLSIFWPDGRLLVRLATPEEKATFLRRLLSPGCATDLLLAA